MSQPPDSGESLARLAALTPGRARVRDNNSLKKLRDLSVVYPFKEGVMLTSNTLSLLNPVSRLRKFCSVLSSNTALTNNGKDKATCKSTSALRKLKMRLAAVTLRDSN